MIPYAILQGELHIEKQKRIPIRVLDLSLEGFTFRLAASRKLPEIEKLVLYFWSWKTSDYEKLELDHVQIQLAEEEDFYTVYRVEINDVSFERKSSELMREYLHYINLKQYEEDAVLSQVLTGYPADREKDFPETLEQWIQGKLSGVKGKLCKDKLQEEKWKEIRKHSDGLGIELESDEMISAFLNMEWEPFQNYYWKRQRLLFHPLSGYEIRSIYLGNGYCFECLPPVKHIIEMIRKADLCNLTPVLVLPPMKERYRDKFLEYLGKILGSLQPGEPKLETVINDWGTLEYVRVHYSERIVPIMGILMNKRRKDSRMKYRHGLEKQLALLKENGSNTGFYQKYLAEMYGLHSFLYDSCGYEYDFPEGQHSVLFPFYQMNTSGHCVLYARCRNGSRGQQMAEDHCPGYCKQYCFLYPSMLSMAGWQNTIWGWDEEILWNAEYFEKVSNHGANRMILQELHLR